MNSRKTGRLLQKINLFGAKLGQESRNEGELGKDLNLVIEIRLFRQQNKITREQKQPRTKKRRYDR